jgi:hypothetical protein
MEFKVLDDGMGGHDVWVRVGDVLDWLEDLPNQTPSVAAAGAALEIRQMLVDAVSDAGSI